MTFSEIFIIACGLSMDALAVSVACGVVNRKERHLNAFKFGASFSLFQMLMPVAGWAAGMRWQPYVAPVDHWLAFAMLCGIGGKMIYEAVKIKEWEERCLIINFKTLICLSLVTSIDALVVGFSFALLRLTIIFPVIVIGCVTFVLSYGGFLLAIKWAACLRISWNYSAGPFLSSWGSKY
ncbi:MAG TPA: manganese efflux pump MntP family protein [Candidatus Omnitrophota bacterium]|nr:manganese efflux pump MntP family protein [Candidatus Omnitrophota bacterium]